ncbi:MAG TPA: metalloregulator ArsR/SmtB family transcription factor [Candidatus Goldiibacteriota bacterium]|nr:metalloregulator ArsR/SmtB family transcription factor [Candidatus Goldiibacteriota bacterium]
MDKVIKMQAGICKTFSNPWRLYIIKMLCKGERNASELAAATGLSGPNLSQHMSKLIANGVVISRKQGKQVFYSLSDPAISEACSLMQKVVLNNIKATAKLA